MANPWLKKNPFMSMWLSEANSVAGSMRGQAAAHVKRHAATAMTDGTRTIFDAWVNAMVPVPHAKRKRRR